MFGKLTTIALGVAAIGTATPTQAQDVQTKATLPSAVLHHDGVSVNSDLKQVFAFQESVIKNLEKEPYSQINNLKLGVAGLLAEVKKLHDAHTLLSEELKKPDSDVTAHKIAKAIELARGAHDFIAGDAAAFLRGSPVPYSPPGGQTKQEVSQQVAGAQNFTSELMKSMVAGLHNPAELLKTLEALRSNFVK